MHFNKEQKKYIAYLSMPLYVRIPSSMKLIPTVAFNQNTKTRERVFGDKITSFNGVMDLFKRLENSKNISNFEMIRKQMLTYDENEKAAYIELLKGDMINYKRAVLTKYFFNRLPPDGISAYYLGNCIYYCRFGCATSLLSKKISYAMMRAWAIKLQKSYSSWQEYFTAFYAGYQFDKIDKCSLADVYKQFGSFASWLFSKDMPAWNISL